MAGDAVDAAELERAQRWNVDEVRRFMIAFGLTSTVFDMAAFALLLRVFDAEAPLFHSAWFVLSLTELAVVLVLRTRLPAWQPPWRAAPRGHRRHGVGRARAVLLEPLAVAGSASWRCPARCWRRCWR
ncbi:MAG: hypothetical protein U1F25_17220 [Rubrivivax sp.]